MAIQLYGYTTLWLYNHVSMLTTAILTQASGGFRLIQMLNRAVQPAACTSGRGGANSVNEALRPLFHLLRAVADRQPAALGASVLGLSEVHARWRHFVASWRALAPGAPLHFCSSDIAQCYDTIDQVTNHGANPNPNGAHPCPQP